MVATRTWDEADPANTDKAKDGATEIREHKVDIRERMKEGGHAWNVNTTVDGRHTTTDDGSGAFNVYKADRTTVALEVTDTYVRPEASVEIQNSAGDPLTRRRRQIAIPFLGTLVAGELSPLISMDFLATGETATLVDFFFEMTTAPTGAAVVVDLNWGALPGAATTARTMASALSAPLSVAASDFRNSTTGFSKTSFSPEDALQVEIDSVGSTVAGADGVAIATFEWPT